MPYTVYEDVLLHILYEVGKLHGIDLLASQGYLNDSCEIEFALVKIVDKRNASSISGTSMIQSLRVMALWD